jgi:signal transduction histidine kinase
VGASMLALIAAGFAVRGARSYAGNARRVLELETDRAKELDLIAQRVAHDLMSPLSAVSISLGAIQRSHGDAGTTKVVDRARRALERSRLMVQGIYAFSGSGARPVPGAVSPLRATVEDAVDAMLAAEPDPQPTVDVEPFEEVDVVMERAVLDVVVSNLLSNACKYTRESNVRRITVRCSAGDAWVHVEVEDTGPGVPAGMEQAIFEPYKRAPGLTQPGLGLGLATVKRLVLAHGGKLGIARAESGGAIFWFDLPRVAPGRRESEADDEAMRAEAGEAHPVH